MFVKGISRVDVKDVVTVTLEILLKDVRILRNVVSKRFDCFWSI